MSGGPAGERRVMQPTYGTAASSYELQVRNVNRSTPQGRWNVGGAFRPCTCNSINRLMGHEYTHSANEYTYLSVWDHPPVWSADSAVSAHLVV